MVTKYSRMEMRDNIINEKDLVVVKAQRENMGHNVDSWMGVPMYMG